MPRLVGWALPIGTRYNPGNTNDILIFLSQPFKIRHLISSSRPQGSEKLNPPRPEDQFSPRIVFGKRGAEVGGKERWREEKEIGGFT